MAKDKLTDYDSVASGNLDVGGISVAEGMLPSGVNNAIRELMSHQADAFGAGTPLYVDQTNNRVGIGNAAPTVPLDVTGAASVSGALTAASATVTGDLTVDTNTLYVDSTNNRVGIGTSSPDNKLTIGDSISIVAGKQWGLDFQDTGKGEPQAFIYAEGRYDANYNTDLIFGTIGTSGSATERMRIDSSGNLNFNSGYGSVATAYGCRAWVNFNGTGTVAIREDGGVSSVTDLGTGNYRLNFLVAFPDANYSVTNGQGLGSISGRNITILSNLTTTTVEFDTFHSNTGANQDTGTACAAIFR